MLGIIIYVPFSGVIEWLSLNNMNELTSHGGGGGGGGGGTSSDQSWFPTDLSVTYIWYKVPTFFVTKSFGNQGLIHNSTSVHQGSSRLYQMFCTLGAWDKFLANIIPSCKKMYLKNFARAWTDGIKGCNSRPFACIHIFPSCTLQPSVQP